MTADESRTGDLEAPLMEAIASFLQASEQGRPPERTEFLGRYPELASELKTFLENHDELERLSRPLRDLVQVGQEGWEGRSFGDFEIQAELGRGGMGVIYRARQSRLGRTVALKMIRAGRLATPEDLQRFRREAEAAASLSHANIVPLYDYGEHEGQPYFTMELIEGHTLDGDDRDFRADPDGAIRLIALVARAIHHAHQRRIIHRDLKPSNILIDSVGAPRVTDFGLAMPAEGGERITKRDILIGTLPYMSPEQLNGQRLTTSVDIWSLGVILYELLTGKTPFQGKTEVETIDRIRNEVPASLRVLNPGVDRDLQAICLKCLEKQPERRFGSALGLALELERCLRGEPTLTRPVGTVPQFLRWCRRKPAIAGLVALSSLLFLLVVTSFFVVSASRSARLREILDTNVHMAQGVATQMQLQFKSYSRPVLEAGGRPELTELLLKRDLAGLQAFLGRMQEMYPSPAFDSWFIVETPGVLVARYPYNGAVGRNVAARDHWQGTLRHYDGGRGDRGVHLSLVYQSIATQVVHYALCIPILNSKNELIAVLGATLSTDDTLGLPNLHDTRRKATLIGPYDPGRVEGDLEPPGSRIEWLVLVHEGMRPGRTALPVQDPMLKELGVRTCPRELSNPDPTRLPLRNAAYIDPYRERDGAYSGRWLAGYAPVGNTGFVVIVQQREE